MSVLTEKSREISDEEHLHELVEAYPAQHGPELERGEGGPDGLGLIAAALEGGDQRAAGRGA